MKKTKPKPPAPPLVEWSRKASVVETELSVRHTWKSTCGRYKITQVINKAERTASGDFCRYWQVIRCYEGGEAVLSDASCEESAKAVCEAYARAERERTVNRWAAKAGVK